MNQGDDRDLDFDEARRSMENALRANPLDIWEQYEKQIKQLQEAMLELCA